MRTAFIEEITRLAALDRRINLVVGDLGFGVVESFARRFPDQFLNAGIAEQNMTGVAAGLALSGRIVFTYSIANFPTLRCLEQLRNDVCYHDADVKVVAIGGGFSYGSLGMTHHATEDLAILRSLPGMLVLAPGDPQETRLATRAVAEHRGPAYLRLGRAGEPIVHQNDIAFVIGKALKVREGGDLTLIATGSMLEVSVRVCELLRKEGLSARLLSMHTIKPLDEEAVISAARETGAVFTLEEHSILGGLGGAVAEVLAESDCGSIVFRRIGLPSQFSCVVGSQEFQRRHFGLDAPQVARQIVSLLKKNLVSVSANGKSGGVS